MIPAEFGWHHTKDIHPVAQLQSYGHSEPAGAQPGVGALPGRQSHRILLKIHKHPPAAPVNLVWIE